MKYIKLMKNRWFGIFLLIVGLTLMISFTTLNYTGNVIGERFGTGFSFLGFVFVLIGAGILMAKKNLAQLTLDSGKVVTKRMELLKIARKTSKDRDYEFREVKEGTQVTYNGKPLTVIPHHADINKYTAKQIIRALATGQSSFRTNYT